MSAGFTYPEARRDETVVEDFHGTEVADPYRYLEDPDGAETVAFVKAQNQVTQSYIDGFDARPQLVQCLKDAYDYPKAGCPFRKGDRYFRYTNSGLQNQYVLRMSETLTAAQEAWQVFLDPNELAEDGTAALRATSFSEDGSLFAYGVSKGGSDWQTLYVRDVASGADLEDTVAWVKFSGISWTHDNGGFFYNRYPKPASLDDKDDADAAAGTEVEALGNQAIYYHRLGTSQEEDILVYHDPERPEDLYGCEVTDDGETLLISCNDSCDPVNRVWWATVAAATGGDGRAADASVQVTKVIDNLEAGYDYICNQGSVFYMRTNRNAPRYRVIAIDFDAPDEDNWQEIIAQETDQGGTDVLQSVLCVAQDKLVVSWMHDVREIIVIYDLSGARLMEVPLPALGTVISMSGHRQHDDFFFKFSSFLYPGSSYVHHVSTGVTELFDETQIAGFDPSAFETRQVFFESKDGTRVPMFVVCRRDIELDGTNPTLLYGYGGFNISLTPGFSAIRLVFVKHFSAVLAVANLRGGGEYGEAWHKDGSLDKKQNVFDDFAAAAEHLIAAGYTSPKKIIIQGGSNGGLLVGASFNQRPDLFGCCVAQVGVMDMLRFHKFSIGRAWCSDYGCSENADDFAVQYAYSPLHNVSAPEDDNAQHPALLLTTADHDDRVSPLHSLKYIATVQHALGSRQAQTNPLMIRVECKAGHGAGKPTSKIIDEYADIFAFCALSIGMEFSASQ